MAHPKLTPRQKMINMMYLVLTALLALNVSRETLDVIARVDKSLNQSVQSFAAKNRMTYAAFDNAYELNKVKVGPFKAKADSVKAQTQKMIDKITEYKWAIVREADGAEANLDSILNQDQLNVPAQIMLVETVQVGAERMSRAKDLRNSIERYKQFMISIAGSGDSTLLGSLEKTLTVKDPPQETSKDFGKTWEQDNFEYLPLIGVITLMTKMQSDVRGAETDVLNHLYKNIDAQSFKFNQLQAVVIPTASTVVQGSPYEADVLLAAFDTTISPKITVGGSVLPYRDGHGKYTVNTTKPGIFSWGGVINYTAPDGSNRIYDFKQQYEVIPPMLISSPSKMNAFYMGVDNPLEINAVGATLNSIKATMTNAELIKVDDLHWIVKPRKSEGKAVLTVTAEINGKVQTYPDKEYRLFKVPDPTPKVGGKSGGKIEKNVLQAQTGVVAELEGFLFDMKFDVKGFKVMVSSSGNFVQDVASTNALFTADQKKLFASRKKDDIVIIKDIVAQSADGIPRTLPSITFTIQ